TGLETTRTLTAHKRVRRRSRRHDAEPDELRTEFVADVHDLRWRFFEVEPHLLDGVVGPPAHAGGGILVVGARFFASRTGRLLLRRLRGAWRRLAAGLILRRLLQVTNHAFLEEDRRDH